MFLAVVYAYDYLNQREHLVRRFEDQFAVASFTRRDLLKLVPEDRHLIHLVDERDVFDHGFFRYSFTRDLHSVWQESAFPISRENDQNIFHSPFFLSLKERDPELNRVPPFVIKTVYFF